ncbi:82 prophage-derived uncharacterized protein ybcO [Actinobacillus lignieresii]|uniref:DUF1364 domain-containing protein n=1 Tax=Actinobacillus lignieresii TaxID=720 RepID=UPI000F71447D|nr:DUF1364 domain-containing protein [Actinobacillus lignieresii]VEB26182.1 82 prophage-derived uncharacterized protein ybcO [Actinobacillus lignieresii]
MANLRKEAKGRECQVRLPGVCNWNPETTVLAHIRNAGITGGGQKANDIHGAYCCSACHDVLDRRVKSDLSREELENAHLWGVIRTQLILMREGKLCVK